MHTWIYKITHGHKWFHTAGHRPPENTCKHHQITNGDTQASPQLHTKSYRHTLPCAAEAQPGQIPGQARGKASGSRRSSGGKEKELGKCFICSRQETHPPTLETWPWLLNEASVCGHRPAIPGSGYGVCVLAGGGLSRLYHVPSQASGATQPHTRAQAGVPQPGRTLPNPVPFISGGHSPNPGCTGKTEQQDHGPTECPGLPVSGLHASPGWVGCQSHSTRPLPLACRCDSMAEAMTV